MATFVISGPLANKPGNGGEAWVRLNWILGLQKLGHEVYLIEQIDTANCANAVGRPSSFGDSVNRTYFHQVMRTFGLADRATVIVDDGATVDRLPLRQLNALAESGAVLVNFSGHLKLESLFKRFRRRIYIDLDPGFTQAWQLAGQLGPLFQEHDCFFTVGTNINQPGCSIPTCGLTWLTILPPVVLGQWTSTSVTGEHFATIGTWRCPFGSVEIAGQKMGLKHHEFRKFIELPSRTDLKFEAALQFYPGDESDRQALAQNGWRLVDPISCAAGPVAYRDYIRRAGAEFSAAQGVYVQTRSGWMSDRTACFLAAGRPALVQDTGIGSELIGRGLVTFRTLDEAAAGACAIMQNYDDHSRAARTLAQTYFDSDRVLTKFFQEAEIPS
ncbi:MAG: hypothetical protein ACJ8C4_06895 [Gemmataceae bacterium]